jgi:hypothetical protein
MERREEKKEKRKYVPPRIVEWKSMDKVMEDAPGLGA